MNRVDLANVAWFKSSYSNGKRACVEVAFAGDAIVPVRDSKDPQGSPLVFPAEAWRAFVDAVKAV